MGYQALLFCPDEKTARTVTQVLGELEFNVEPCIEPFAAVKKLMGQHFDAVVVDCDNEQNATLLFKSARNSTSNQTSLAVAVVEGQAGVAKAFRIGANLVLTKPINVEQAKGTLRVARGLLRKGDPTKSAAATASASAPAASAATPSVAPAAAPIKTAAARPAPPAKPVAPAPRPAAPPVAHPVASPAVPVPAAAAHSTPAAQDDEDLLGIKDSLLAEPSAPPVATPAVKKAVAPVSPAASAARLPAPAARTVPAAKPAVPAATAVTPAFKAASPANPTPTFSSGAASAPAPARETSDAHVAETAPASAAKEAVEVPFEKPAEATHTESPSASTVAAAPAPSFTFGGANAPEAKGGSKKILVGIATAALVVAGLYFGWTYLHGRAAQPQAPPPVTVPRAAKPNIAKPAPAVPAPSASLSGSEPAAPSVSAAAAPASNAVEDDSEPAPEKAAPSTSPSSPKPSSSASSPADKAAAATKTTAAPLVVKGGAAPAAHAQPAAPDADAPSMIGIAAPGSGGSLPNVGDAAGNAPKPILQFVTVSQGVSQGLLFKKVQPVYPRSAITMHVEGSVQLLATISKSGEINSVKVLSGPSQLTAAARDAVKQWKYKPYLLNGEPVEIQTQITVNFKLPN